jgi:hypothetical protein
MGFVTVADMWTNHSVLCLGYRVLFQMLYSSVPMNRPAIETYAVYLLSVLKGITTRKREEK